MDVTTGNPPTLFWLAFDKIMDTMKEAQPFTRDGLTAWLAYLASLPAKLRNSSEILVNVYETDQTKTDCFDVFVDESVAECEEALCRAFPLKSGIVFAVEFKLTPFDKKTAEQLLEAITDTYPNVWTDDPDEWTDECNNFWALDRKTVLENGCVLRVRFVIHVDSQYADSDSEDSDEEDSEDEANNDFDRVAYHGEGYDDPDDEN